MTLASGRGIMVDGKVWGNGDEYSRFLDSGWNLLPRMGTDYTDGKMCWSKVGRARMQRDSTRITLVFFLSVFIRAHPWSNLRVSRYVGR